MAIFNSTYYFLVEWLPYAIIFSLNFKNYRHVEKLEILKKRKELARISAMSDAITVAYCRTSVIQPSQSAQSYPIVTTDETASKSKEKGFMSVGAIVLGISSHSNPVNQPQVMHSEELLLEVEQNERFGNLHDTS